MPGKGKVKGKKKLKKGYNNKLKEENSVTAYATSAQDNVASPIPKDALAAEFSNILDDLKNNNKVCYPEEDKGRGILQSMLKVAIKRDEEVKGGVGGDNGHMKGGRDKEDLEINCFKRGNPVVEEDHYEENNTLQVLSSIVDPMSQLSEKVSKIQLSEMLDSEITTSDESTTFNGDEAEILQEDDVKQTLGKIDSPEPDLQLAIDLVASRVGEEGNVIKDLSKDSAEDKFTRLQEAVLESEESGVKSESDLFSTVEHKQWRGGFETTSAPQLKTLKHPLQHEWTFWHLNPDKNLKWSEKQQKILTVGTVEDFWAVYNWTLFPSQLRSGSDYSLFKAGVRPDWEDERNVRGGRWMVIRSRDQLDLGWREITMALVGETLGQGLDERVTGAVVNVRGKTNKVGVWLEDNTLMRNVGERLREVLGVPDRVWAQGAEYRPHK